MSNWPNGAICEKATRPKGPLPAKGGGSRLGPCRRRLTTDPQSEGRLQGEVTSGVSSDAVDTAALVIAIISLVLAVLSLAWQAVTFVLTGPRVKVCLKEGLRGPLGVMIAFIIMQQQGVNANIMSLGGIAIAIGAMVDAAIVMTERPWKRTGTPNTS